MRKALAAFVIVTGILTAITVAMPDLIFIGLIFFILPGLILSAAPTAFLVSAAFLIGDCLFRQYDRKVAFWGTAVFLAAVSIGLPLLWNAPTNAELKRLPQADRAPNTIQIPVTTLAFLIPDTSAWSRIKATECIDFCQRLLFNGSVPAVLMGPSPNAPMPPGLAHNERLVRYRIERRLSCPPVNVPDAGRWENEPIPGPYSHGTIVSDNVKARIAAGECLIAEPTDIAEANVIIVDQILKNGAHPYAQPWSPYLDTISARRLSVHERKDGTLHEIFRQTALSARPVVLPLFIAPDSQCGGGVCSFRLGIGRKKYESAHYDLRKFLWAIAGINVGMIDGAKDAPVSDLVRAALADASLLPDSPRLKVVDQYLKTFRTTSGNTDADVELLSEIITDWRTTSGHFSSAISRLGYERAKLVDVILKRLAIAEHPRDGNVIEQLSNAIQTMPTKALAGKSTQILAVADNEKLRNRAWKVLTRISDDGAESVPILLKFIDSGQPLKGISEWDRDRVKDAERDLYFFSGLIGLCLLGSEGDAGASRLLAFLGERAKNAHIERRAGLTIVTLVRMGKEQDVEELYRENTEGQRSLARYVGNAKKLPAEKVCVRPI